ncbi:MAG TPA: hypothetical protein VHG08_16790 [Longimicrobium sp.]|nr:hypothetical protein [Longimicrobium sp.]
MLPAGHAHAENAEERKRPSLSPSPATIDGPQQAGGRDWWKIDDGAGMTGWSSSQVLGPA